MTAEDYAPLTDGSKNSPNPLYNYNVVLTLTQTVAISMSDSIWSGMTLAAYIYIVTDGSNSKVGFVEAAQGLATLITALPIGYIADHYGRSRAAFIGGIVSLIAIAATTFAVWLQSKDPDRTTETYDLLVGAMCLWGFVQGIASGPIQALYADSIPTGERTKFYHYLFAAYLLASTVGPAVTIAIFQTRSNTWTLGELRVVIYVGMGLEAAAAMMMFLFSDKRSLGKESDSLEAMEASSDAGSKSGGRASKSAGPGSFNDDGDDAIDGNMTDGQLDAAVASKMEEERRRKMKRRTARIPILNFVAGLITALGSGMTVKFFPLFFKNDCHMSPTGVQCIYIAVPVVMFMFSDVARRIAGTGFGRVQTIILCRTIGVSALFLLVWLNKYRGTWYMIVPLYLFRTGIMNCTYPLEESIIMDYVPKETRARWKSLESVAMFGWCGSAALGGYLADKFDYNFTFLITAFVQGSATVIWAFLIPLVPRQELKVKDDKDEQGNGGGKSGQEAEKDVGGPAACAVSSPVHGEGPSPGHPTDTTEPLLQSQP